MHQRILILLLASASCLFGQGLTLKNPGFVASLDKAPVAGNTLANGLLAWWKLDESSGTTAADSSVNGKTATLTNAPSWVAGKFGNALSFSPGSAQSAGAESVGLASLGTASISCWMQRNSSSARVMVGCAIDTTAVFAINFTDDPGILFRTANGSATFAFSSVTASDTSWHSVIVTFDGSQSTDATKLLIYIDGTLDASPSFNGPIPTTLSSQNAFRIGKVASESADSNGLIDDVRIYNRVLTQSEVTLLQTTP